MSTQIEKVVMPSHTRHAQQLLPDTGQHLFHRSLRRLVRVRDQRLRVRRRQRFSVDLPIGRQGHHIELHEGRRHHVFRQRSLQVIPYRAHSVYRGFAGTCLIPGAGLSVKTCPVRHQSPVARLILPGNDNRLLDTGTLTESGLDLTQLDSQAAYLDLKIIPAQILDGPVGTPAAKVARPVQPGVHLLAEWVRDKTLIRERLAVQISPGNAFSTEIQLACHTAWHELAVPVKYMDPDIRNGPANGHPAFRL